MPENEAPHPSDSGRISERAFVENDKSGFDCLSCGACCAPRAYWRVYVEVTDVERQRLPEKYALRVVNGELKTHPRRGGVRCVALAGTLGVAVRCDVHPVRPAVCREFAAGSQHCRDARAEVLGWR